MLRYSLVHRECVEKKRTFDTTCKSTTETSSVPKDQSTVSGTSSRPSSVKGIWITSQVIQEHRRDHKQEDKVDSLIRLSGNRWFCFVCLKCSIMLTKCSI